MMVGVHDPADEHVGSTELPNIQRSSRTIGITVKDSVAG
jgi:hypothetical protein